MPDDPSRIEAACVVLHGAAGWGQIKSDKHGWADRERSLIGKALAAADASGPTLIPGWFSEFINQIDDDTLREELEAGLRRVEAINDQ